MTTQKEIQDMLRRAAELRTAGNVVQAEKLVKKARQLQEVVEAANKKDDKKPKKDDKKGKKAEPPKKAKKPQVSSMADISSQVGEELSQTLDNLGSKTVNDIKNSITQATVEAFRPFRQNIIQEIRKLHGEFGIEKLQEYFADWLALLVDQVFDDHEAVRDAVVKAFKDDEKNSKEDFNEVSGPEEEELDPPTEEKGQSFGGEEEDQEDDDEGEDPFEVKKEVKAVFERFARSLEKQGNSQVAKLIRKAAKG